MTITTHPQSQHAAYLLDLAIERLGVVQGNAWMFSANVNLDGRSPIEAIRAGELEAAHRAVMRIGSS